MIEKYLEKKVADKKIRNSGIEMLRLVCVCFFIMSHMLPGVFGDDGNYNRQPYIIAVLDSIFSVSVAMFMFISGYFGCKFSWKRYTFIISSFDGKTMVS